MNLHKHQLYLLEQYRESFNSWSAISRINTEVKSYWPVTIKYYFCKTQTQV